MGRGYIGESGADKALNKMDKFMQRNKEMQRNREESKGTPTLLQQFKAAYPDTWEEELTKARKEYQKNEKDSSK